MNTMIKRSFAVLIIAMAGVLLAAGGAQGSTLYWSGNGATLGGTGTWNTTSSTNWGTAGVGPFGTVWTNANKDTAVFVGIGAPVTLTDNITVGGLTFNKINANGAGHNTYYTIDAAANSKTLSFASGDNTLLFANGNGGAPSATITGQVGGSGANVIVSAQSSVFAGGGSAGTLTFNGASTGGWSGTATINHSMTLALAGSSQALKNTSSITLNGGGITLTSVNGTEGALDRVADGATITVNGGGTITYANSSVANGVYAETNGTVNLVSGQLNIVETTSMANGTQSQNNQTLVLAGLNRDFGGTNSVVSFRAGNTVGPEAAGNRNMIRVNGITTSTAAGQILGPWATTGRSDFNASDYAKYVSDGVNGFITAAGIAHSLEDTWTTASNAYTFNAATPKAAAVLSATRNVTGLKVSTVSSATGAADTTTERVTWTGHALAEGAPVYVSGALPGGLTAGNVYYVRNPNAGTDFQLSATPADAIIDLTSTATIAGISPGILVSSGNNLGTRGIFATEGVTIAITATGTGAVTLPDATSAPLFVTTAGPGACNIFIAAPIADNGAGKLTLVKSGVGGGSGGQGVLTLAGNNTFTGGLVVNAGTLRLSGTQSFTGGVTLSGGAFGDSTDGISAAELGSNSVTVNGNASMYITSGETLTSAIAISSTGNLKVGFNTATLGGVVSGSGVLTITCPGAGSVVTLSNTANTHIGVISIVSDSNGPASLNVNSLADSASPGAGNIQMGGGATLGGCTFALHTGAVAPLILNNRQVELVGDGPSATYTFKLANNSSQAFTINSNLRGSGSNVKTLTLGGSGTGLSTFGGIIGDGGHTTLNLTKADNNNTWALTATNNTYSGVTTVSGGILSFNSIANVNSGASALGAPTNAANGTIAINNNATLRYTGSGHTSDRVINMTGATTLDASGTGALVLTSGLTNSGAFTKTGTGILTLSGSNAFTAASTVTGGGMLILDYSAQDYSKLSDAHSLTLGGTSLGGTLTLKGDMTRSHVEVVSATSLNAGGTFLTRDGANTAKLRMNVITRAEGGTISFADASIADTDNNNVNGILGGYATLGNDWAVSVDAGAANTAITALGLYNGALPSSGVGSGTANYTLAGDQPQSSTIAANTVKITGAGTLALGANALTITSSSATSLGGMLYVGAGGDIYNVTGSGNGINASGEYDLVINTVAGTLNVSAKLNGSNGARKLVKTGAGTLVVSSTNDYTGATYVNQGVLRLANAKATGTTGGGLFVQNAAAVELSNGITIGAEALNPLTGTGVANGGALRNFSGDNTYSGTITLGTGGARINSESGLLSLIGGIVTAAGKDLTIGGAGNVTISTAAISGTGNLIKDGAGTNTLSFANTYTGTTTINAGTLALGTNNALPSATAVTINNATLAAGANTTNTFGTLDVVGNATINLGTGAVLAFADSRATEWTGTLNITGSFVSGESLRFGTTTGGGLTSDQLSGIVSSKYKKFTVGENGYLTAVAASPGTVIMLY